MSNLPDKPSALIRVALADLAKVEADTRYRIDMGEWVSWHGDIDPCAVCFAGAVIVGTLGRAPDFDGAHFHHIHPHHFNEATASKLHALNDLRVGSVRSALDMMGIPHPSTRGLDRKLPPYEHGAEQFRAAMEALANDLQMVGL